MLAILLINIAHFMNAFIPELCWNFPFQGRRINNSSKFTFEHGEGDECFNDTHIFTEQMKQEKEKYIKIAGLHLKNISVVLS